MKLTIISLIVLSLTMSLTVQARESDRHSARKSAKPNNSKSYKPRQYRRDDGPRTPRHQAQPANKRNIAMTPKNRNNSTYRSESHQKNYDRSSGFGSPKKAISNNKRLTQNNVYRSDNTHSNSSRKNLATNERSRQAFTPSKRPEDRANYRSANRESRLAKPVTRENNRVSPERRITTREVPKHRNNSNTRRPENRTNSGQRISSNVRLPETMPIRRYNDSHKNNAKRYNNGRRVVDYRPNKRDNFRYQQHRWLVNKQKHRRHSISMPRQLQRYRSNHFRGQHQYGTWHRGHHHYHYDYRYRYLFNPYQWYDDYYYHAYFDWRWNHPHYWNMSGYYTNYMDPYYCPDDFGEFVTTLAVGALILNW